MYFLRQWSRFFGLIFLGILPALAAEGAEPDNPDVSLKVRFWADEVEVSGKVRDLFTRNALLDQIRRTQPGAGIWDAALNTDPSARDLPPMRELSGVLMELALSTRDGRLEIGEETIVVSGETDSFVTHAAFDTRLKALAVGEGSRVRNDIRVVSREELAEPRARRPVTVLDPVPLASKPFEISEDDYGPLPAVLRARPVILAEAPPIEAFELAVEAEELAEIVAEDSPEIPIEPAAPEPADDPSLPSAAPLGPMPVVRFSANTYLVTFDQRPAVKEVAEAIMALEPERSDVVLLGYPDRGGRYSYNDWLSRVRAQEVKNLLVRFGVPETQLSVRAATAGLNRSPRPQVEFIFPSR